MLRAIRPDGVCRNIEFRAQNLLDDPDVHGIVLNWHDVTEQIATEKLLKEREHFFRTIMV